MGKLKKEKTVYFCNNCGSESSKWLGRCPQCGEWNTLVETTIQPENSTTFSFAKGETPVAHGLKDVLFSEVERISSGYEEVDRVLGGGIVPGALLLLGGDPGIGKSTLLLQISHYVAQQEGTVLYVSGEESPGQIKLRADRLQISGDGVSVLADTQIDRIMSEAKKVNPKLLVIDSIQTMYNTRVDSMPGSVGQVKECTAALLRFAKESGIPVVIIGHVTKDGAIAGPRMLEHMVDVVLYFEGERSYQFRVLKAIKNRFGSTSETGIFNMEGEGLVELLNPSEALLAERSDAESGSAIMAFLEGQRPILVEVQSLVVATSFGIPRRTSNGYDLNRLLVLLAVLEKRAHLSLGNKDVYVNVVGGLKIGEPACDLAMAIAIASNLKERPVPSHMVIMGEVGLTGNIRSIPRIEQRVQAAVKMGFTTFIVPSANMKQLHIDKEGIVIEGVTDIRDALEKVFASS